MKIMAAIAAADPAVTIAATSDIFPAEILVNPETMAKMVLLVLRDRKTTRDQVAHVFRRKLFLEWKFYRT